MDVNYENLKAKKRRKKILDIKKNIYRIQPTLIAVLYEKIYKKYVKNSMISKNIW